MTVSSYNADKIRTLSPKEQFVYIRLLNTKVARMEDLSGPENDRGTLRKNLSALYKKGYVLRVYNGLYIPIPPELLRSDYEADRYLVASKAFSGKSAISHHSALELLGVAQSHFTKIFISIPRSKSDFEFQDIHYKFIYDRRSFGITTVLYQGIAISVTDKERTLLDCIKRPKYAGGAEELLKSISGFTYLDFEKLESYLSNYNEVSLYQRTGFVLNLLRDELQVPMDFLLLLKGYVGRRRYYLEPGVNKTKQGKLDRDFNIIAPSNIKELIKVV